MPLLSSPHPRVTDSDPKSFAVEPGLEDVRARTCRCDAASKARRLCISVHGLLVARYALKICYPVRREVLLCYPILCCS